MNNKIYNTGQLIFDIDTKELTDIITRLKQKHPYLIDCIKDIRYSNMKDFHSLAHLFDHSRKLHFSFAIFIIFSHNIII